LKKQEGNKILNKKDHLIQLAYFKTSEPKWQSINEYGHEDDITDVDWANRNGRTYHMICSTSKDGKFIIWEINLLDEEKNNNFVSCKIIHEFKHSKPLWRCCFNDTGIFASCIDEDGNTFIFLKVSKDKFVPLEKEKIK
jgi:WD40 repeat protein